MAFPLAALAGAAAGMGGGGGMNPAAALTGLSSAAGALTGKFTEIVNTASRFVQAFDPAIVAQLNRAFQALDATIGVALRPVIEAAIKIVRGFGGTIDGIMRDLQPIVAKVADSLTGALQGWFDYLAEGFAAIVPILEIVGDALAGVADMITTYFRAIRPFVTMLIELGKQLAASIFGTNVGDQVKGMFAQIQDAMKSFIKNLLLAVASFLKLIGATQTLDAFIRGTKPRAIENIDKNLAPQNASFQGLADVAKALTLAAFTATAAGGNAPKKQEDYLAGIQDQLQAIKDGDMSMLGKQAQDMLNAMLNVKSGVEAVARKVQEIYDKLPEMRTLDGRAEAEIDAKADRDRAAGGLKQYNPGKNDSFLTQLFRS